MNLFALFQGDLVWFDSGLGFMSPGIVVQVRRNPLLKVILNEDTNEVSVIANHS